MNGIGDSWREFDAEKLDYEYSPSAWSKRTWEAYQRDFALESARDSASIGVACVRQNTHRMLLARTDKPKANLVWIHGGYWQGGNATDAMHHAEQCLEAGFNYAAIDYTIAPDATLEQMVQECIASVQAIATLTPAPIIIAGHSAGAHLAAMVASARPSLIHSVLLFSVSASLAEHCHSFVHIPHYDERNNESHKRGWLTMESCLSIVLHQFTAWAGYDNKNKNNNNNYQGQKYHVQRVQKGAKDDLDEIQKRNEERRKKIQRKQEELEEMEKEDGGLTGYLPGFIGGNDDKNNGDY